MKVFKNKSIFQSFQLIFYKKNFFSNDFKNTIYALSTGHGKSAIAVIRVSGE